MFSDDGLKIFDKKSGDKNTSISLGHKVGIKLLKQSEKNIKKKMNIILTRPLIDTENLMQELFNLGHKIMHIPTLKIHQNASLENINIEDYIVFVLQVLMLLEILKQTMRKKILFVFVWDRLLKKLLDHSGFTKTISASGNVHALKKFNYEFIDLNEKSKIAYICGDQIFLRTR